MNDKPTIIERKALGNLLEILYQGDSPKWNSYIKNYFENWNPIYDQIPSSLYCSTLASFPQNVKRTICKGVILGWNEHQELSTLYQVVTSLINLKVCDTTIYFFLQEFYNFIVYFKEVSESINHIMVTSRINGFTLRFLKPNQYSIYGDTYGTIDFQLSHIKEEPFLIIAPSKEILVKKLGLSFDDNDDASCIMENLYPILNNEFIKRHNPCINSNWDFGYNFHHNGHFVITMHSLQYSVNNGY